MFYGPGIIPIRTCCTADGQEGAQAASFISEAAALSRAGDQAVLAPAAALGNACIQSGGNGNGANVTATGWKYNLHTAVFGDDYLFRASKTPSDPHWTVIEQCPSLIHRSHWCH